MNPAEEIAQAKKEYSEKITAIIQKLMDSSNLKITGYRSSELAEMHTVELYDGKAHDSDKFLTSIWVANRDEDLSNLKEYDWEPEFEDISFRRDLMEYIEENINE